MDGPATRGGYQVWTGRGEGVEVRFVGTGPRRPAAEVLAAVAPGAGVELAWTRQVHSARVLPARGAGLAGEGDALWSRERCLALAVVTADCVPLVLAGGGVVAAVHAGWRGIAAGVVTAAVAALPADPGLLAAWIGPAIGPCCYEVGEEVAARVAAAAGADGSRSPIARPGPAGKPHLDLAAAVRRQLAAAGVASVTVLDACTRCQDGRLFSYRRQGKGAGRNLAFVWRTGAPAHPADPGRRPAAGRRRR